MSNWFEINKAGLANLLARKGKEFIIYELLQNAWDEAGVTDVTVTFVEDTRPGYSLLTVHDNAPQGFSDLTHAYTLFASSKKKNNPEQRGRFNMGDKLVLALATEATISTTTGTITFDKNGRHRSSKRMPVGSMVQLVLKMSRSEREACIKACEKLLPPTTIRTSINGQVLTSSTKVTVFTASLATEVADSEDNLVRATRMTLVTVYKATDQTPAAIYEMGIPVTEIDGKYIFDVGQKVPLTMDRENVLPKFSKQLAVAALNALHGQMDAEDANCQWAEVAMTSPDTAPEAVNSVMTQRFGVKRVIYDPSDIEANNRAAAAGYTVIKGGTFSAAAWSNVKSSGAALPAGQVTPSPKPYSPDGKELTLIEPDEMMRKVEEYAIKFAREVLGVKIAVLFAAEALWPYAATYGPSHQLVFNVGRLGRAWFHLHNNREAIDDLLIHEFGHEYTGNHLSEEYYKALTRIGARLAQGIRAGRI